VNAVCIGSIFTGAPHARHAKRHLLRAAHNFSRQSTSLSSPRKRDASLHQPGAAQGLEPREYLMGPRFRGGDNNKIDGVAYTGFASAAKSPPSCPLRWRSVYLG